MNPCGRLILLLGIASLLGACAANSVKMENPGDSSYHYAGQKVRWVSVTWAPANQPDPEQLQRFDELDLRRAILNKLYARRLFADDGAVAIVVSIDQFEFDRGRLAGQVTLKDAGNGSVLAVFDVSANAHLPLSKTSGSPVDDRLGGLGDNFGALTAEAILQGPHADASDL